MTTIVLGAVGSYFGGPVGGFIGGAIGSYIDSIIFAPDPTVLEGPGIGDLTRNADSPGGPISRIWGTQNRVGTTQIWTSNLIETVHETEVKGGKLDSEPTAVQESKTYSVNLAVAVGFSGVGGTFTSFPRIWAGNKLLYDATQTPTISRATVTFYTGTLSQLPDATIEAAEGAGQVPGYRGVGYIMITGWQLADWGNVVPPIQVEANAGEVHLQTLVGDLCDLGNIPVTEQALLLLDNPIVPGFVLARLTSPRAALDILSAVYRFDMADNGNKVTFRRRNRAADSVILEEDLGTIPVSGKPVASEITKLEPPRVLPREIILKFNDPARDLQINSQRTDRLVTDDTNDRIVDYPGTLTVNKAREVLDDLLTEAWQAKREIAVSLPAKYIPYEAGDIIRIKRTDPTDVFWPRYLISEKSDGADWRVTMKLRPLQRQWAERTAPASSGTIRAQTIPATSESTGLLFDTPLLFEGQEDQNGLVAAIADDGDGNEWLGANLYQSLDTVNYSLIAAFGSAQKAIHGVASTILGVGPHYWPDRNSTVDVIMTSGALSSISELTWIESQSANAAILGSELINFRDATFISGTTYRLSGLKRGRLGTDHAISSHGASETFLLLTTATVKRVTMANSLLFSALNYKAVTVDNLIAPAPVIPFTIDGVWAECYAGQDMEGARDGSDNLTITWDRRDRRWFDSWASSVAPMSEVAESYEVDIMDGATVKRTIAVSTPSASYLASEQTTDGFTPGDPIEANIYQISARVDRGYVLNDTV